MGKQLTESEKHQRYKKEVELSNEKYNKRIMKTTDPDKITKISKERDRAVEQLQLKWIWSHKRGKIGK